MCANRSTPLTAAGGHPRCGRAQTVSPVRDPACPSASRSVAVIGLRVATDVSGRTKRNDAFIYTLLGMFDRRCRLPVPVDLDASRRVRDRLRRHARGLPNERPPVILVRGHRDGASRARICVTSLCSSAPIRITTACASRSMATRSGTVPTIARPPAWRCLRWRARGSSTPAAARHSSCGMVRKSVACSARGTTRRTRVAGRFGVACHGERSVSAAVGRGVIGGLLATDVLGRRAAYVEFIPAIARSILRHSCERLSRNPSAHRNLRTGTNDDVEC